MYKNALFLQSKSVSANPAVIESPVIVKSSQLTSPPPAQHIDRVSIQ